MTIDREELLGAVAKAADWLEANPDKHIQGRYAVDDYGNGVHAAYAKCMCAIGAVACQMGASVIETEEAFRELIGASAGKIIARNDADKADGIRALRELVSPAS